MKFKYILKGLTGVVILSSFAVAKNQNDCEEIKAFLKGKEYADKIIEECIENEEGQVTTL